MNGQVIIGTKLDTKSFDKQIKEVEYQLEQLDYELSHAKELKLDDRTIKEYELKAEKLTNQLASLRKKQEDLNTTNLSGITSHLDNIGGGVEKVIKKVTRWGLALFGIRSMYSFIRSSMSTLSGYNDQLATDVEYIRFALATTLQPIIERIIQLVYTLLQYIGYIAKAWFGVNIFANATTKAFQKGNKQAKQMQKTLAGFDEMNVLSDNSGGDSSGGATAPSIDLSEFKDFDTSIAGKWLDKLKNLILKGFDAIVKNVKKIMKDLGFSQDMIDAFSFWIGGVRKMLEGFLDFIIGILKIIVGLFTGNTELLKEGFKQAINGLITFLKGVLQMFVGEITMIVVLIGQILKTLVTFIKNNIINPVANFFSGLWNGIINGVKWAVNNIKSFFNSIPSFLGSIVNRIISLFRNIGSTAGNVLSSAFKSVINAVLRRIESTLNYPIRTINNLVGTINKYTPFHLGRLSTFSLPRLAKGGIVNMPGRGVPVGGAIAGERGQEGVIPLTDSQQMALLGEAIGRYITVNANITNTMNGRVISREIQRVQNNSNFAMNR